MKKIILSFLILTVIVISGCNQQMSPEMGLNIPQKGTGLDKICSDFDGDGFGEGCSLGIDCAEEDPTRWFWRPFYLDEDQDFYGTGEIMHFECWGNFENSEYPLDERSFNSLDCEDLDANINPGALEICGNGIDEDCDGSDLRCNKN
ncbi:hypothetical protein HOA59_03180 [archaeon]|jgi:hypothetical protein|nr:hypothetical protein [archaeon]MBT6824412.1 hypothetical protein [archaeon]MBT7107309.1 hypothetical protein [archaeon]MBT7297388.1 hypothetical protein [archaeon]